MHAMADDPSRITVTTLFYRYLHARNRHRLPTRVEQEWIERLRNAVVALQNMGAPASVEQEMSLAIEAHTRMLEARYNAGEAFPERDEDCRPGRRYGVHRKSLPPVDAPAQKTDDEP